MFELVLVEKGEFLMGDNNTEKNEAPAHSVALDSFYIGSCPVTQKEWKYIFGKAGAYNRGDDLPIEQVTFPEILAFCNKLSLDHELSLCYKKQKNILFWDISANGYRLPTEAEWEYAARGGNNSKNYLYSGSNDPLEVAWFKDNSDKHTHEVCTLKPNEIGIYDMSGNVYEFCWDVFSTYTTDKKNNSYGKLQCTDAEQHVMRGGNCHGFANRCRSTSRRKGLMKGFRQDFVGFRIAKNAE